MQSDTTPVRHNFVEKWNVIIFLRGNISCSITVLDFISLWATVRIEQEYPHRWLQWRPEGLKVNKMHWLEVATRVQHTWNHWRLLIVTYCRAGKQHTSHCFHVVLHCSRHWHVSVRHEKATKDHKAAEKAWQNASLKTRTKACMYDFLDPPPLKICFKNINSRQIATQC